MCHAESHKNKTKQNRDNTKVMRALFYGNLFSKIVIATCL